jgi:hypothetical protein
MIKNFSSVIFEIFTTFDNDLLINFIAFYEFKYAFFYKLSLFLKVCFLSEAKEREDLSLWDIFRILYCTHGIQKIKVHVCNHPHSFVRYESG